MKIKFALFFLVFFSKSTFCMNITPPENAKIRLNIGRLRIGIDKNLLTMSIGIGGLLIPHILKQNYFNVENTSNIAENAIFSRKNQISVCNGIQIFSLIFLIGMAYPHISKEFFVQ